MIALDPELMDRIGDGDDEPAVICETTGGAAEAALKIVVPEALYQNFADLIPDGGHSREQFCVCSVSRAIERGVIRVFIVARHDDCFVDEEIGNVLGRRVGRSSVGSSHEPLNIFLNVTSLYDESDT